MSQPKERWIVYQSKSTMTEEAKRLKNLRKTKLTAFNRKQKNLQSHIEGSADIAKLQEAHLELKDAFKALEGMHESYVGVVEEAVLEEEGDYMESPSNNLHTMDTRVTERICKLREEENLASDRKMMDERKNKFKLSMEAFGNPSKLITELSIGNTVSFADMRIELSKVETSYENLVKEKIELLSQSSTEDFSPLVADFQSLVIDEVEKCKSVALAYMKDTPPPAPAIRASGGASSGSGFSVTKRETVMLPHFSGDEKTAYLKFPVWKEQWTDHIKEYEERYRPTMLLNHLDEKAQLQIVGLETNYEEAMKQLESYYGDSKKIIRACLDELRSQSVVSQFDYKGLVQYKKILLNNYARLKAAGLQHEMSNTAAMGVIIRKFPIHEAVEWQKFLSEQDKSELNQPFPAFIRWLEKAGTSWELLAAAGTGIKGKSGTAQVHHSFYGEEGQESDKVKRVCYKCGQEGHMKKDCGKKDHKSTGGGKNTGSSVVRKPRAPPKHKKFHCAYHKGASDRFCVTWSCPSVKYTPYSERVKLMKENLDCKTC